MLAAPTMRNPMINLHTNEDSYEGLATTIIAQARTVVEGVDKQQLVRGHEQQPRLRQALSHFRDGTILEHWDDHAIELIALELEEGLEAETLTTRQEFVPTCWIDDVPTEEGYVRTVRDLTKRGEVLSGLLAALRQMQHARQELYDGIAGRRAVLRLLRGV